jgi:hypothetical protein
MVAGVENPRPASHDDVRASLAPRDVFAALPAVSAVTVGALYGLGVLLSVSQLVDADVAVSETLPLIPLQDHLAKGLAAVFTSVVLFAAVLAIFSLALWGYASSRSFERRRGSVAFSLDRASAAATAAHDAQAGKLSGSNGSSWKPISQRLGGREFRMTTLGSPRSRADLRISRR